jgi:hypothetical protein
MVRSAGMVVHVIPLNVVQGLPAHEQSMTPPAQLVGIGRH